jgi:hypothetical protein
MDDVRASAPPPYESVVRTQPMHGPVPVHYGPMPGSVTYYPGQASGPGGIGFVAGPPPGMGPPPGGIPYAAGPNAQPTGNEDFDFIGRLTRFASGYQCKWSLFLNWDLNGCA